MRLLGVTIDSCLSWDAHIGQIIKKMQCNPDIAIPVPSSLQSGNTKTSHRNARFPTHSLLHIGVGRSGKKSTLPYSKSHQLWRSDRVGRAAAGQDRSSSGISGMGQDRTAGAGERPTQNLQSSSLPTIPTVDSPYVYPSIYGVSSYYPFNRSWGLGASKMQTLVHSERVPLPSLCLMESAASGHYRAANDLFLPYISEGYGHESVILSG